jgi:hypothetical protein
VRRVAGRERGDGLGARGRNHDVSRSIGVMLAESCDLIDLRSS